MKKKKVILITAAIVAVLTVISIIAISILTDDSRLSVTEKEWISNNKNNVISLNVINDLNVFGKDGKGVFFDFIESLSEKYNIQINPVTFNHNEQPAGLALVYSTADNVNSFYEDEFVLVGKKDEIFDSIDKIKNLKIGVTKEYSDYISKYLNSNNKNELKEYDDNGELLKDFKEKEELEYILVPKLMYLDTILAEDYHILYHISDAKIHIGVINDKSEFSSIITKYFKNWKEKEFEQSLNKNELDVFTNSLKIASKDIEKIRANNYKYGFVVNEPYELIGSGNFGGINASYLRKFSDLLDIKIDFVKYKDVDKLNKAINNGKVDLYFDYYLTTDAKQNILSNIIANYDVIVRQDNSMVVTSLSSLNKKTVYVEENTKIYNYLKRTTSINLKTYKNDKELKKIAKKDNVIIVDSNKYEGYKDTVLKEHIVRYTFNTNESYRFKSNVDNEFNTLLKKYFEIVDNNEMRYKGLNNYYVTKRSGTLLGTLAKYILVLLAILAIVALIAYKKGKKIKLAKRIKKEDKMRFIDQLTSLKNRNYLTENLESWNNNTIYPQAVIAIDLNRVQEINDTLGYEKGDNQIQAAANILIKTQLDNTDIIRTDGNEFLIYLVGYETKQITSYIHKLTKEFKKLPFDYGACIGYSMILDDVKSIEDATNEAVEQIKEQKEEIKDE